MILRRLWIDGDGVPRCELASWLPSDDGALVQIGAATETDDSGATPGRARLVALAETPVDPDAYAAAQPHELYQLPLIDGARLVDRAEWDAAQQLLAVERDAARVEVAAQLAQRSAARDTARRDALRKLAAAAGLDDDETAALVGGL